MHSGLWMLTAVELGLGPSYALQAPASWVEATCSVKPGHDDVGKAIFGAMI